MIKEFIYSDTRWPRDLTAGSSLVFDIRVERGGPAILQVVDMEAEERIYDEIIQTQSSGEVPIENDGTHTIFVSIGGDGGEVEVSITTE